MKDITFHLAGPDDAKTLTDYRIRFAIELSGPQEPEKILQLSEQTHEFFISTMNTSCISVIAKSGSDVAGIGSVHIRQLPGNFKNPGGKWGYIMNMYTVPAYRRKGVGSKILNELITHGKAAGITAFELHATKEGELVYSRTGFEPHHEPTYRKFIHSV